MKSKHALAFIFITVLIDTIGFGIIIPVIPSLITSITGEGLNAAARYGGWLMFVYALTPFFCAPIIGNLSDRYGRRPVLLLSLFALAIDYVIMGFAASILVLFVGRMIAGAAGATFATANAFIADVSSEEERAQNFGLIGAAFGIGFIIGPAIGGLLGEFGPRVPFFAAAALALLNMIYGYFILPETLAPENRRPFKIERANPVGAILQMRGYPIVFGLLGAMFFFQIAHDALPATWTYYTMERYDWSERDVGFSLAAVGVIIALVQGLLIRVIIPYFGEELSVYWGFLVGAFGFVGYAFAPTGLILYLFMVPQSMMMIASSALRGIMSKQIPVDSQGELQGALSSLMGLTAMMAPVFMTQLFGFFTSEAAPVYFPGVSFFAAGILVTVTALIAWSVLRNMEPSAKST